MTKLTLIEIIYQKGFRRMQNKVAVYIVLGNPVFPPSLLI